MNIKVRVNPVFDHLKGYLKQNERVAISLFNTILSISEDRMYHFKYNVSKLKELGYVVGVEPAMWKSKAGYYGTQYLVKVFKKELKEWEKI